MFQSHSAFPTVKFWVGAKWYHCLKKKLTDFYTSCLLLPLLVYNEFYPSVNMNRDVFDRKTYRRNKGDRQHSFRGWSYRKINLTAFSVIFSTFGRFPGTYHTILICFPTFAAVRPFFIISWSGTHRAPQKAASWNACVTYTSPLQP